MASVTLDERLAHDALAVEIVVHVGRVEVGEAPFEEGVDHAFDLGDVHGLEVAGLCERQPHTAESQFAHRLTCGL